MRKSKPRRFSEDGEARRIKAGTPVFDWAMDQSREAVEDLSEVVIDRSTEDACDRIEQAIRERLDEGFLMVRYSFGATKRITAETAWKTPEHYEWYYDALPPYTSPFAAVLHGSPATGHYQRDFCKLLGVDHYYAVGFLHGWDATALYLTRKAELEHSSAYRKGYDDGQKLAAKYCAFRGGHAAKGNDFA